MGVFTGSLHPPRVRERETLTATELQQAGPLGIWQALDGVGEKGELGVTRDTAVGHCGAHTEAFLVFGVPPGLGVADIWQRPAVPCGKLNGDLAGLLLLLLLQSLWERVAHGAGHMEQDRDRDRGHTDSRYVGTEHTNPQRARTDVGTGHTRTRGAHREHMEHAHKDHTHSHG